MRWHGHCGSMTPSAREDRLDHRDSATVERHRLQDPPRDQQRHPDQPGALAGEVDERARMPDADRRRLESPALLEDSGEGEDSRRYERQNSRHASDLADLAANDEPMPDSPRGVGDHP
jgi:hypothetical protein